MDKSETKITTDLGAAEKKVVPKYMLALVYGNKGSNLHNPAPPNFEPYPSEEEAVESPQKSTFDFLPSKFESEHLTMNCFCCFLGKYIKSCYLGSESQIGNCHLPFGLWSSPSLGVWGAYALDAPTSPT